MKCIVMHMIRDDPTNDWSKNDLAKNFIEALKQLQDALEKKILPSFFIQEKKCFRKCQTR